MRIFLSILLITALILPAAADWQPMIGDAFDISHHPVKLPQLAAGALMFLRGDVRAARQTIQRTYSRQQVADSSRLPGTGRIDLDNLAGERRIGDS